MWTYLTTVFNVSGISKDSQFRDVIDSHSYKIILEVFKDYFSRLQRAKYLNRFQIFGNSYLITIDGSEYFSSKKNRMFEMP